MQRFQALCLLVLFVTIPLASETFRNPRRIPITGDPIGIKVADLNNDGIPDLIYGLPGPTINVLLGQAGGTYLQLAPFTPPPTTFANCSIIDVDSDHKPDLVCPTTSTQPSLLTFFGNGDGTFQSPVTAYQAPLQQLLEQFSILNSADVNGDGHPDLILNRLTTNSVSVLLGDGAGHFSLSYTLPTGPSTIDNLNLVDVNGDGKLDIVRSFGPDVLLGNGDGTFSPLTWPSLSPAFEGCVVKRDLDGDGHPDAVCRVVGPGQSAFAVLHGNPDGSFNTSSRLATVTVSNPHDFIQPATVEDINHDGLPDLLVYSNEGLLVFLAEPGLHFNPPAAYTIGYIEVSTEGRTTLGDANGDGSTDLLTGGVNGIYITYGHADGTFDTASAFFSGLSVSRATVADFNNDGIADVVTSDAFGLNVSLGAPGGAFAASSAIPSAPIDLTYTAPFPLLHGDFDGDGNQDLVVQGTMDNYSPQAYFLHGKGDGTFTPPVVISYVVGGEPATIATNSSVADLNRDGRDDLISMDMYAVHTRISQPGGGFSSTLASPIPAEVAPGVFPPFTVGDFDHDGIPDVVVGLKNVHFLHGQGDGTFAPAGPAISVPQTPGIVTAISSADFDQDGNLDIAVLEQLNTTPFQSFVFVYYGNGDGTFGSPVTLPTLHTGLTAINIADFNRDGRPDLLLTCGGSGCESPTTGIYPINVLHSLPNRTFSQPDTYVGGTLPSDTAVADVSGDRYPDIVMANGSALGNAFIALVNQPGPTVTGTLTVSPEPSIVLQPFTLTATLSPPDGSGPSTLSGSVSFSLDGSPIGSAPVNSNTATFTVTSQVARGTHRIAAVWSGDNNYPGITLSATHTINGYTVALPLTANPNPAFFGQRIDLQQSVSNSSSTPSSIPAPSGTLSTTNNGVSIFAPVSFTNGVNNSTALQYGFTVAGQHTIVSTYSGDSLHESATATLVETVNPVATSTNVQSSPNPSSYGQPVTLSATITIPTGNALGLLFPPPAPTVTFTGLPGGPVTGLAAINASASTPTATVATATYTANALPGGSYAITAAYSGNINSQPSTSPAITHIVQAAPTTTTLAASPASAYPTQTITLSARVSGALAAPTGSIQFFDGATPLTIVPLASGTASFATTQLSVGTHNLTAVYSGDASNLTSTSSAVTVTIFPSDFTLSLDPPSISLITGHHATLHLSASSVGIFADTVRLSTSNLPEWVTVRFTPTDLKLSAGNSTTSSVYVDTDAVIGYMSQANSPLQAPRIAATASVALALVLAPITVRRRRTLQALLALTFAAALLAAISGCSGKYPDSTPPGNYTLQITATAAQTGVTHTIALPLTVTK